MHLMLYKVCTALTVATCISEGNPSLGQLGPKKLFKVIPNGTPMHLKAQCFFVSHGDAILCGCVLEKKFGDLFHCVFPVGTASYSNQ